MGIASRPGSVSAPTSLPNERTGASSDGSSPQPPTNGAGQATFDVADLSIPLSIGDIIPPSPATSEVTWAAQERLIQECMADRGFEYDPLPSPGYETSWIQDRRNRVMTAERAATVGYHPIPFSMNPELDAAYEELEQRTSDPAYLAALGAQTGEATELGCNILTQQQINGDLDLQSEDFNRIVGEAEQQVINAVLADPAYSAAVAEWTSCMNAAGHQYNTPEDAFNDPRWTTAPEADDTERAVAQQDATCREEAGLNDALWQAQRAAVAQWIDENTSIVEGLQEAEEELLERAQSLLDS